MRVARQKRRMAVSSNCKTIVPLRTLINKERSFDQVKVDDIELKTVPMS